MTKIKVAQVIRVFSYGGAEISLKELLGTTTFKENCTTDVFILDHKKLGLVPEIKNDVRHVYTYCITTWRFLFEYIKFLQQIRKNHYHIVHMHLPVAGWMAILSKIFCPRTKYVYSEHTLVSFYPRYNFCLSGLTYRFNDSVISVSQEVSDEIKRTAGKWMFKRKNAVTILNGVNTDKFCVLGRLSKVESAAFTVGLVARFRPHKRIDRWIEVAEKIHSKNKAIRFILFGDGPDEHNLRNKVAEKNLQEVIHFAGRTSDTINAYSRIDVFLLTSELEGLPLSLMEAMSCGCVPAVNDVGGIRQLHFKEAGFKFSEFDAEDIAGKIIDYATDPGKYNRESKSARAFAVQSYSLDKQANQIIDLYKNLSHYYSIPSVSINDLAW